MRDIYSNVADLCGFVEESTERRPLVKKATIIARKRAQDLYLEEVELEDDIELEDDEELDVELDEDETSADDIESRLTKLEELITKLSEQIEGSDDEEIELELEDDEDEDDLEFDIEDDQDLIEGEGMEVNLEGKGCKEESRNRSKARLIKESRKAKALDYLKKKKQDLILESIELERDLIRKSVNSRRKPFAKRTRR